MEEAIWFFAGVISFKLISKLLEYKQLLAFTAETGLKVLMLSANILHDIEFMQVLKYEQMRKTGVSEEELQLVKDIDQKILSNWKDSVIFKFKNTLPRSVSVAFTFHNWDTAMKTLDRYIKMGRSNNG